MTAATANNAIPVAMAYDISPIMNPAVPVASAAKVVPSYYDDKEDYGNNDTATITAGVDDAIYTSSLPPTSLNKSQLASLQDQGYTKGLAMSLNLTKEVFAMRYWVVDNSSSMRINDGKKLVHTMGRRGQPQVSEVDCSRWDEVQSCVEYHVRMAALLEAPTKIRLLNHPGAHVGQDSQHFAVATTTTSNIIESEVHNALSIMEKTRPGGCTPLTGHIQQIYHEIKSNDSLLLLRKSGQRVVVVIATDGLPTDERGVCNSSTKRDFVKSLKQLEELPVWVVIRLSTDEEDIVSFYDQLDQQLELDLDLLDDFKAEAIEVTEHNPWLNYALPLHRLREMGYQQRVMDLLDERPLTKDEIKDFCCLVFGTTGRVNNDDNNRLQLADPSVNWKQFLNDVDRLQRKLSDQYDPIEKKNLPWINIKKLNRIYGDRKLFRIFKR